VRILTVDDNHANLEFLEAALWTYGCPIDRAKNGLEAMGMVTSGRYDLVITDINMPVMNGLEFYKGLVEKAPYMRKKVIFTTSDIDAGSERLIKQTGCSSLRKPLRLVELRKAVDRVMDVGKERGEDSGGDDGAGL
jgi:two-component system chemotaxis response regulator CheY